MRKKLVVIFLTLFLVSSIILLVYKVTEPTISSDQTVVIMDKYLNDARIFEQNYESDVDVQNYTIKYLEEQQYDGSEPIALKKPCFMYQSELSESIRFRLTPKKSSDYIITIPKDKDLQIVVEKKNYILRNSKQTEMQIASNGEKLEQYHYSFKKGCTYYIYVINDHREKVDSTIEIEQDNWIYAPYGAYAEYGNKDVYYFSYNLLLKTRRKCLYHNWSDEYYEDKKLEEISKSEMPSFIYTMGYGIYDCTRDDKNAEQFSKYYVDLCLEDKFQQDLFDSAFNICLITSNTKHSYDLTYEKWNQQNFIPKYMNDKRTTDYVVFGEHTDEITAITEFEWEKYIK